MAYEDFFGFKEPPFRLTPDPDYYFPSDVHKEALQSLLYSIRSGEGFAQITGEPGTGKTLILRTLLKELGNEVNTALVLNPKLTPQELLGTILEDLGIDLSLIQERSKEERLRYFREYLLEEANRGISTVIIIDEAQNLPNDTMEELRLLSNLETEKKKLLQIILVGQVELEKKLQSPELKQLDQRITIRYRMGPLSRINTIAYVNHRLQIAGGGRARFSPRVLGEVYKYTGGVPRLINIICERALMAAFVESVNDIEKSHIKKAVESIRGDKEISPRPRLRPATVVLVGVFLIVVMFGAGYQYHFFDLPGFKPLNQQSGQEVKPLKREVANLKQQPVVKKKVPSVDVKDTRAPHSQVRSPIVKPTPPVEAFHVPLGKSFISFDRDKKTAYVWQGDESSPKLRMEFAWDGPLKEGLYVLGEDSKGKHFIFNYLSFFQGSHTNLAADGLWEKVKKFSFCHVVPLLVYSSERESPASAMEKARQIPGVIDSWAGAWKDMDIERYTSFYGNIFTMFSPSMNTASVFSRDQLCKIKRSVFSRSGKIFLDIADPFCTLDPSNPRMAIAVFYQTYSSLVYSDEGIKVLYLSLVDNPEGESNWKIVGKLWMPLESS